MNIAARRMERFMSVFSNGLILASAEGASTGSGAQSFLSLGLLVLMFGIMYFVMIRPQRKKQKAEEKMRSEIQVGDDVTTIGGIVGRVVTIKEDSLIIETGSDRAKMRIKRWAIASNDTSAKDNA